MNELNNELENSNNITIENVIENNNEQKSFMTDTLKNVLNTGLNVGLRLLLPNIIEDEVISIKDTILENGLIDGTKKIIDNTFNFAKSVGNVLTGKFESVEQIEEALKTGGTINQISETLSDAIDLAKEKKLITNDMVSVLKKGKKELINSITNELDNTIEDLSKTTEHLNKHMQKWQEAFDTQNLDDIKKEMKYIQKDLKVVLPVENTLNEARKMENIHNLVLNNKSFDISNDALELAEKLT